MNNAHEAPLAGVDLNLLVVLDALLAEGHVTRAARRVGLSQSATSHALTRLRSLLDDPILVRTGAGMVPTDRAEALREPVREALALLARALRPPAAFDPASARGRVTVSAVDFAQSALVPALVARLAEAAPGVDLVMAPYPADPTRALSQGEIDLCVGLERELPQLHQEPLWSEPFTCVVRRGHPCLRGRMTVERYAALDHAMVSPRAMARGFVDRGLRERGLRRRVRLVVPHFLGAVLAVTESDLVLTIAASIARRFVTAFPIALFDPPLPVEPFTLTMAWHTRQEADPLLAWLREQVRAAIPRDRVG